MTSHLPRPRPLPAPIRRQLDVVPRERRPGALLCRLRTAPRLAKIGPRLPHLALPPLLRDHLLHLQQAAGKPWRREDLNHLHASRLRSEKKLRNASMAYKAGLEGAASLTDHGPYSSWFAQANC